MVIEQTGTKAQRQAKEAVLLLAFLFVFPFFMSVAVTSGSRYESFIAGN